MLVFKIGLHFLIMFPLAKRFQKKNTILTRQEKILQLLFLLLEIIIEINKNQNFKK